MVEITSQPAHSTFSLAFLMQVTTGCSLFFAVLILNPPLAIFGAIVVAPAIIRTGVAAEKYRSKKLPFGWGKRIEVFIRSLAFVCVFLVTGSFVFVSSCVVFCLFGYGFGSLYGDADSALAMAFISGIAGVVWGIASSMVTSFAVCNRHWDPLRFENRGNR